MLGNICMVFPEHLKHEVIMDQNVLVWLYLEANFL
jgi:hypothetical protein